MRLRHWNVPLLVCAILVPAGTRALEQSTDTDARESGKESLSLAAAVELAELGELGDAERTRLARRGSLSVTDQPTQVRAVFELDGSEALVSGDSGSDGRIELVAQVSGILVDATYDSTKSTFHLDGHGHSFGLEERVLLQAFAFRLEEEWSLYYSDIGLVKQLSYNLINYLSEAPVGYRLESRTIRLPSSPGRKPAPESSKSNTLEGQRSVHVGGPALENFECNDIDSDTGVTFFGCEPPSISPVPHDACPEHGWQSQPEFVGRAGACLGRCGVGCGSGGHGWGKYTVDCAAHDSCCKDHGGCTNPSHWACGDEYAYAVDDFIHPVWNCNPPPLPCGVVTETITWVVGPRDGPKPASEQIQFGLERIADRPEAVIYLEEWAVLSIGDGRPTVREATTEVFASRAAASVTANGISHLDDATMLVVEAAVHPHNARHIPTPELEPFTAQLDVSEGLEAQELWFRAEVAAAGSVDSIMILDGTPSLPVDAVEDAVAENLRLRYADTRRHRSIVFGRGSITNGSSLVVDGGLVIVPQCCCDDLFAPCDNCQWNPQCECWICA